MKTTIILSAFVAFFSSTHSAISSIPVSAASLPIKASEVYFPVEKTGRFISLMDFSRISIRDFETLAGKKMRLLDKVNFRVGQRELKKSINRDGTFNKKTVEKYVTNPTGPGGGFSLGGLALGFFLSLLGVLIAYVIAGANHRSRVTWAWIGFAISSIIWIVILV